MINSDSFTAYINDNYLHYFPIINQVLKCVQKDILLKRSNPVKLRLIDGGHLLIDLNESFKVLSFPPT